MAKTRLLILDDHVGWRRLYSRLLEESAEVDVLGACGLGELGLEKLKKVGADCVLLGISSSGAEGAACRMLESIKAHNPKLPVLVASSLAAKGSPLALECLSKGAAAVIRVPDQKLEGADPAAIRDLVPLLVPQIQRVGRGIELKSDEYTVTGGPEPRAQAAPRAVRGIEAVVIGISTGGPIVLEKILGVMPEDLPVPVFVVQHTLPGFTQTLASRLNSISSLTVGEAAEGVVPKPSTVWIAPNDRHLEVVRNGGDGVRLRLTDAPPENQSRPAADVLFRSAAKTYGSHVVAGVLPGMGCDGLRGCRAIREAGGVVLVQDKASSVVWGMPGAVAEEGLAHEILPPDRLAVELIRRVGRGPISASKSH